MAYNWGQGGGGSNNNLTPAQLLVMEHLFYNEVTATLEADVTFKTTVDSLHLGDQHSLSSGLQNTYFTNLATETSWYPSWGGLVDQSNPDNHDARGVIPMSGRIFAENLEIRDPLGPPHADIIVDAAFPIQAAENRSTFEAGFILGEEVVSTDVIRVSINVDHHSDGTSHIGYSQRITGRLGAIGEIFSAPFDHPMDLLAGDVVNQEVTITKLGEDPRLLQVRAGIAFPQFPYLRTWSRTFVDENLAYDSIVRAQIGAAEFDIMAYIQTLHPAVPPRLTIHQRDGNRMQTRAGEDIIWDLTD